MATLFSKFKNSRYLEVLLQRESAECGLVALLMLMNYYGLDTDLLSIRERYMISLKGLTLLDLKGIAEKFNFKTVVIKFDFDQLSLLKLPCILHWELNHFVVLSKIKKKSIIIHDPAVGKRIVTLKNASDAITGIAFEIKPNEKFLPLSSKKKINMKYFLGKFPVKKFSIKIIALTFLIQIFSVITPQYIQKMVDGLQLQLDPRYFILLGLLFIGVKLLEIGISALRTFLIEKLNSSLNFYIGWSVFKHLVRLPLSFFEKRTSGELISKFGSIDKIIQILTRGMIEGIIDILVSMTLLIIIWLYDVKMALLVTIGCTTYAFFKFYKTKNSKELNDKLIKLSGAHHTYLIETIRGMQSIKIFSKEGQRGETWKSKYIDYIETNAEMASYQSSFLFLRNFIMGSELIIVILIAAFQILNKEISIGMLYAFIFYRSQLVNSFTNFIDNLSNYQIIKIYLTQLSDVILQKKEFVSPISKAEDFVNKSFSIHHIKVERLYYKYGENEKYVLSDLSFEINAHESVAIIAPSGFGKTTLMKIMMGLIEPTSGTVKINGLNLTEIDKSRYRKKIASVMQDDQLFYGSIYENVAFFDTSISSEKIITVCKLACIHDEIMQMPMQYYSLVGDMGTVLSGGQKQRVLLARALYRQPEVLFLDEATSHLDLKKEQEINKNIANMKIMRIIIAHRAETISSADRCISINADQNQKHTVTLVCS